MPYTPVTHRLFAIYRTVHGSVNVIASLGYLSFVSRFRLPFEAFT